MEQKNISIYQAFLDEGVDLKHFDFNFFIKLDNQEDKENDFDFAKVDWENLALSGVNYKVLILGNPGVGKSATTDLLARILDLPIVDTDVWFRSERAKSENESPVTKEFFDWIRKEQILAWNPSHEGSPKEVTLNLVKDSKACRKAEFGRKINGKWVAIPEKEGWPGEDVFRKYEELLLKHGFASKKFDNAMLVTSSTAPTREANVAAMKAHGYKFLLLNPDRIDVYLHLFKDWQAYKKDGKSRRGAYEEVADKAYNRAMQKSANLPFEEANDIAEGRAFRALAAYWDKVYKDRSPKFNDLLKGENGLTVNPVLDASKIKVAAACLGAMVYMKQREI